MPFDKLEVEGDSNVGMHVAASEDFAVLPPQASAGARDKVSDALGVDVLVTTVGGSSLVGALCAMNSGGAAVTRFASEGELSPLREAGLDVEVLDTNLSASGNVVLANDAGALVHPELDDDLVEGIGEVLDVPVERGKVGPYKTVGSSAVVTNEGMLLPSPVRDEEAEELEKFFGVPSALGSVNYGVKMVGTGVLANSKGFVAGMETTGAEMGRIEEALFPELA